MTVPGKFDVSATGAAIYTIPIAVPPGTAGMAPALTLDYSSQSGDGMVGLGWSLGGLPTIARCPQTMAQDNAHIGVHYNERDRFCLEGQRLVRVAANEYRTEIEGFSKILAYGGSAVAGPDSFKVWTKAGQIMEFGNTADSRVLAAGNADHAVRLWAVNKISDSVGNYLTVTYNAAGDPERTADGQLYPTRIDYTGNDNPPTMHTYNHIDFKYLHGRGDVMPRYEAGSLQRNTVLLTDIQTFLGESTLVADYHLDYAPPGTTLRRSELSSVKLCDSAALTSCLAATTFTWQGTHGALSFSGPVTLLPGATKSPTDLLGGDFNGDGLTDADPVFGNPCAIYTGTLAGTLEQSTISVADSFQDLEGNEAGGTPCLQDTLSPQAMDLDGDAFSDLSFSVYNRFNRGRWFLYNNRAGTISGTRYAVDLSGARWQFADFNGDGRSDFLAPGQSNSFIYYSKGGGVFDQSGSLTGLSDTYMTRIPADFDGDGCADILVEGYHVDGKTRFFCDPSTTSRDAPNWLWSPDPNDVNALAFGDFNGDGKTDVLRSAGGDPGAAFLSDGKALTTANWIKPQGGQADFSLYSIYTGDFNGDGQSDLLLIADGVNVPGTVHHSVGYNGELGQIWLATGQTSSQSGGSINFEYVASIPYTGTASQDGPNGAIPGISAYSADWNGDGAMDIAITKTSGNQLFTMSYAPDLLKSVSNGIGSTTTITYDRLNKNGTVYAKCATAGAFNCGHTWPVQDIDGPLYVVTKVETSDGIGGLYASTYAYGQGTVDLKGRGFQGFATRIVTDKLGLVQTTRYGTQFPFLGLVTSESKSCPATVCGADRVLSTTTITYEDVALGPGIDGVQRHFAVPNQIATMASDLDGTALPSTTTDYTYDCDSQPSSCYGNALKVVQTTALAADTATKTTVNTFDNDTANWFLGRLRTATVTSVAGNSTIVRESAYDYYSATGILKTETIEPNNTTCNGGTTACVLATAYSYDSYGNRIGAATTGLAAAMLADGTQVLAPRTRATLSSYDDGSHRFPTTATNALNQSEGWQYSPQFGLAASHTGPNGQTTAWTYDTFGRKTREHRPDGTETQLAYATCAAGCPANGAFQVTATPTMNAGGPQIGPKTITYYDALYRVIATDVQGFGGRWIRQQTDYDAHGRPLRASRPFFLSGGTVYWTTNTSFDQLGRATLVTKPDGSATSFAFHGLTTSVTETIIGGSVASETTTTVRNARGLVVTVTNALSKSTRYTYDALGTVSTVTDPAGNVTTNTYDVRGNKIAADDPDMGAWHYSTDAFGALYRQTDAKGQVATLSYDALGRAIKRVEADHTSQWVYGTDPALFNVGKLVLACTGGGVGCIGTPDTSRIIAYDAKGRPSTVTIAAATVSGSYGYTYDGPTGRLATLRYPSNLKLRYQYDTALGYMTGIVDFYTPTTRYYGIDARDAEMHLVQSTSGNGAVAIQNFDARTGQVAQIRASADGTDDGSLAHYDYNFDSNGTLMQRSDWLPGGAGAYSETFCTDALNRLTSAAVGTLGSADCHHARTGAMVQSAVYDDLGNITSKSDVGAYTYGGPHPHAVMQISGLVLGNTNPKYTYDANGNLTCVYVGAICGADTSIRESTQWTAANRVKTIRQGTFSLSFDYDCEHQRIVQHEADGSTLTDTVYLNDSMSGALSEKVISSGTTTWRDYLVADGRVIAEHIKTGALETWNHFILDHLGSIAIITGDHGAVLARQSYDPWGRMRNADGSPDTACGLPDGSQSTRGFTGQEQMPRVCLVNLNARLYDPTIGRFLSPDSFVSDPFDLQNFNRYSYVDNNPLSSIDPTGNMMETVIVTAPAYINPALAVPVAIATVLAELGMTGALSAEVGAIPPSPPANVAPQSPIQASGNQTGIPQMQNTALGNQTLDSTVANSGVAENSVPLSPGQLPDFCDGGVCPGFVHEGYAAGPNGEFVVEHCCFAPPGWHEGIKALAPLATIPATAAAPATSFWTRLGSWLPRLGPMATRASAFTSALSLCGSSPQGCGQQVYRHYGYAADAAKFGGGLRPGSFATTATGLPMTGQQAQQLLALPHDDPPDSFYNVYVPDGTPTVGPQTVPPEFGQPGGGIQFRFPNGTPPGSVYGPFPVRPEQPPG